MKKLPDAVSSLLLSVGESTSKGLEKFESNQYLGVSEKGGLISVEVEFYKNKLPDVAVIVKSENQTFKMSLSEFLFDLKMPDLGVYILQAEVLKDALIIFPNLLSNKCLKFEAPSDLSTFCFIAPSKKRIKIKGKIIAAAKSRCIDWKWSEVFVIQTTQNVSQTAFACVKINKSLVKSEADKYQCYFLNSSKKLIEFFTIKSKGQAFVEDKNVLDLLCIQLNLNNYLT